MSNIKVPEQSNPPEYNQSLTMDNAYHVDLEQGIDLCVREKVNKQSLSSNIIKSEEKKSVADDCIEFFSKIGEKFNYYYPEGRFSTRNNYRWCLLVVWSFFIVLALDKKFKVKQTVLNGIELNKVCVEFWESIVIYIGLFVYIFFALICKFF